MHRTGWYVHFAVACIAVVLVFSVGIAPATGLGTGPPAGTIDGPDPQQRPLSQQTPVNNTTIRHERPDNVSRAGDTEQVSRWLEGRLTGQLEQSAIEISQGEYERARDVLGDEYDSRLEQYVDVAGETSDTDDDQATDRFRDAQANQRDYATNAESYEETYDSYLAARADGNTTATRQYARQLERDAERLVALNESLQQAIEQAENRTGITADRAQATLANTTRNISQRQDTVRTQTFVETRLTVTTNDTAVAFDDPVAVTGQVTTTNGTAVTDQRASVSIGTRTYRTETDSEGQFRVVYRPTDIRVSVRVVPVRFRPALTSPYLGTETTANVTVSQVRPSIEGTVTPATLGYRATLTTRVTATIDGRPVPELPIGATLGRTETGQTTDDGTVQLTQPLPATVPLGEQPVRIAHTRQDRAIGPVSATVPVTVTSTATTLNATATAIADRVLLRGRLATVDGRAVRDQPVSVAVGETVRTVATNRTGWYRLRVANISGTVAASGATVPVTARFDGSATNLESARAETRVEIASPGESAGPGESDGLELTQWQLRLIGGILAALVILVSLYWLRRRGSIEESMPEGESTDSDTATPTETANRTPPWIERAETALAQGELQRATVTAYGAVRGRLARQYGFPDTLTHQEFLYACDTEVAQIDRTALRTVADAYEQATFTGGIGTEQARTAVDAASSLSLADPERD